MTVEQYAYLMESWDGLCGICRLACKPYIDHCHTTGKIRGLLCNQCNTAIGLMKENLDTLRMAVQYLETTDAKET
jgi:hypothetical protein